MYFMPRAGFWELCFCLLLLLHCLVHCCIFIVVLLFCCIVILYIVVLLCCFVVVLWYCCIKLYFLCCFTVMLYCCFALLYWVVVMCCCFALLLYCVLLLYWFVLLCCWTIFVVFYYWGFLRCLRFTFIPAGGRISQLPRFTWKLLWTVTTTPQ